MTGEYDVKKTIDCIEKTCSDLVSDTSDAMKSMESNDYIEILSDYEDAEDELKKLVLDTQHELVRIFEEENDVKRFILRKI
ncbi:MAG: putative sulfur carrier protein [Candidatus Thorarchaeota archaeon]|nr:MAG: putative sulfur carrier protein [Candidatus Thorarchaeota archaeon]